MNIFKNKKIIIGIIGLCILTIGITIFLLNGKAKSKPENKDVNHLTEDKNIDGLKISGINIEKTDTEIIVKMNITNTTKVNSRAFNGYIVVLDREGNDIGKVAVKVPDIEVNEIVTISADINEYYGNARDFRLEKK